THAPLLSLHDALPIFRPSTGREELDEPVEAVVPPKRMIVSNGGVRKAGVRQDDNGFAGTLFAKFHRDDVCRRIVAFPAKRVDERSEEHTSELQSRENL